MKKLNVLMMAAMLVSPMVSSIAHACVIPEDPNTPAPPCISDNLEATVEKVYANPAHGDLMLNTLKDKIVTVEMTTKTISMTVGTPCPPTAMCIWSGIRTLQFKIESVTTSRLGVVTYRGTSERGNRFAPLTISVSDYSNSTVNFRVPAFTVIEITTPSVAPFGELDRSIIYAGKLMPYAYAL